MTYTMRVSLPGNDAGTTTDIDKFALYADADNILIKEKSRGSIQVDNASTGTIAHNLGYKPLVYVYGETSTDDKFKLVHGYDTNIDYRMYLGTANLFVYNNTGTDDREVRYFIFHDEAGV